MKLRNVLQCNFYIFFVMVNSSVENELYASIWLIQLYNVLWPVNGEQSSIMFSCFLPARRYASAGLCDSDVSVRPSVCPSVCPSVRRAPVLCLAERKQDREVYTI